MRRTLWRFGKIFLALAVIFGIGILLFERGLIPTSWAPPDKSTDTSITSITGDTPFEKVESLIKFSNEAEGNDFLRVYFVDYSKSQVWKYSVVILDDKLFGRQSQDQAEESRRQIKLAIYWSVIEGLFVKTAQWDETLDGIVVAVSLPIAVTDPAIGLPFQGFIFVVDKERASNIRRYPQDWAKWLGVQDGPEKIYSIPQSVLSLLMQGEKPESVPNGKTEEEEKGETK